MTCEDLGPYKSTKGGRPPQSTCKRGHQHPLGAKCLECRRLRDQWRYHKDPQKKITRVKAWKQDFKDRTGIHYDKYWNCVLRKDVQ